MAKLVDLGRSRVFLFPTILMMAATPALGGNLRRRIGVEDYPLEQEPTGRGVSVLG